MTSDIEKEKQKLALWFFVSALAMLYAGFWGGYLVLKSSSSYWGASELIVSFGIWKLCFLLLGANVFFLRRILHRLSLKILFVFAAMSLWSYLSILLWEYNDLTGIRLFLPATNLFASFFYAFSALQGVVVGGVSLWIFHKVFLTTLEKDVSIPKILTVFLVLMELGIFAAFYMR